MLLSIRQIVAESTLRVMGLLPLLSDDASENKLHFFEHLIPSKAAPVDCHLHSNSTNNLDRCQLLISALKNEDVALQESFYYILNQNVDRDIAVSDDCILVVPDGPLLGHPQNST